MEKRIFELIERIGNLLRASQREAGAAAGLQPVHLAALNYLSRANRYSDRPAAVAEYLGLTKGTASQSLLVLERDGYIEKKPDRNDKRVVHLSLTARGRRAVRDSVPQELAGAAIGRLSRRDQADLDRGLTGLLSEMQAANNSRTFGVCRTCRYFTREPGGRYRCGLTQERLTESDSGKICREHELAAG